MKIVKILSILLLILYILNPTMGVFEIIPDNLPWVGNLDEALAVTLLIKLINSLKTNDKADKRD